MKLALFILWFFLFAAVVHYSQPDQTKAVSMIVLGGLCAYLIRRLRQ